MKILFFTDQRSNYRQGYYYVDWLEIFRKHHEVIVVGPGFPRINSRFLREVKLAVIGHGAQDHLLDTRPVQRTIKNTVALLTQDWRSFIKRLICPKVIFSKNDYKAVAEKAAQFQHDQLDLLVTHSKAAIPEFAKWNVDAEWIPFGVDLQLFYPLNQARDVDLGFIGNLNDIHNDGLRTRFIHAVNVQCSDLRLDIRESQKGENFLFGRQYVEWINRCQLMLNTVSAIGTVGPKWWEEMACGTVPLAPVDEYEGLLLPDIHYVAVQRDFSDLREQVDRFRSDVHYRSTLLQNITAMAKQASMESRYQTFMQLLSEKKLI
jgi:hypothetical protein